MSGARAPPLPVIQVLVKTAFFTEGLIVQPNFLQSPLVPAGLLEELLLMWWVLLCPY